MSCIDFIFDKLILLNLIWKYLIIQIKHALIGLTDKK